MRDCRPKNWSNRSKESTLVLVLGREERHIAVSIGGSLLDHAQSPASGRPLVLGQQLERGAGAEYTRIRETKS